MDWMDYGFYKETFGGSLSESEFSRVYPKAAAFLNAATQGRIKNPDTNILFALSELCDLFHKDSEHAGVSSESSDGYSVHYRWSNTEKNAWEIVKIYLESTGMLYGGHYENNA